MYLIHVGTSVLVSQFFAGEENEEVRLFDDFWDSTVD
ncbi:hypothetical protein NIES25_55550 (plasmid) [Nostoc linckia NIES-25]|nr:hypothetical protein NIES25_55550 [Nostoc linckia NIES-25]